MEVFYWLLDLAILGLGCLLACVAMVRFGGVARNGPGLLATGLYAIAVGVGLTLLPQLLWERARSDNAFLGLLLTVGGGLGLRDRPRPGARAVRALLVAAGGAALSGLLLALRGPGAWQIGSGQFGFEIILACVVIGAAVFALARRSSPPAPMGSAAA